MRRYFLGLLALFAVSTTTLRAQNAQLSGRIEDSSGASVPKASVTVLNVSTGIKRITLSNDEGIYSVASLPPGIYKVSVQASGFQTVTRTDIKLEVEQTARLDFKLQVGTVEQTITVSGGTPLINTESAAVSTVVDRQFVENIPLNGRSFQSLIALTPGVVLTKAKAGDAGQFSVNGQRADANYFMVDGVSANAATSGFAGFSQLESGSLPSFSVLGGTNNLVSVDAMQEFKVQTSSYSPEFGRTAGGQISIVTRSGTNQFHGALFDYFRNDALDANDWFANRSGLPKPQERQNDFGGVFGGPIIKNRTFFFFSYEGLRLRQPQTSITSVPSLSARQNAPAGMQPFFNALPLPTGPGNPTTNFAPLSATFSDPSTLDAASIRVDHTVGSKLSFFARYNYAPSQSDRRGVGGVSGLSTVQDVRITTQTLTSGATLAISSAASNDLRVNYSHYRASGFNSLDNFGGAVPPPDSVLFPSPFSSKDSTFCVILGGTPGCDINPGVAGNNLQRQINIVDSLSVVSGAHQLKFGMDYRRLFPISDPFKYQQLAVFNGVNGALSGTASFVSITATTKLFPLFTDLSFFGQDTWRVTPRLTLTYGFRWELNPSPSEKNGNNPFAVTTLADPAKLALAPAGTPLYKTNYNNFAPRVGLAYQLSRRSGREIVLRAGFGTFYDLGSGLVAGQFAFTFPFTPVKRFTAVPFPLDPASAAPPSFSLNPPFPFIQVISPDLKHPYTYQWNLALEQSLGPNQTLSTSYVAAVGRRLLLQEVIQNPNPNFTQVNATLNAATSDYHALQVQFRRRLSRGVQALASYTWAHSIDNISSDAGLGAPTFNIDLKRERGSSDFDVRHSFNTSLTYEIPTPWKNRLAEAVLGHFSLDTIFVARSATPVNVVTGASVLGGFGGSSSVARPDLVPGVPLYISDPSVAGGQRINKAAFDAATPTAAKRQGTLGRNALRGFPVWQLDSAVRRQFNLTERFQLQFKVEFFNIFNHPNFGDPGPSTGTNLLTNPRFGQSVNMLGRSLSTFGAGFTPLYQIGGPRSIQLALKLMF